MGHIAGDELLRRAAQAMQAVFRASNIIARIGGDEFGILLPKTDVSTARQLVQRIRDHLHTFNAAHPSLPVQLSIGVSVTARGDVTDAFKLADAQMYADKRTPK